MTGVNTYLIVDGYKIDLSSGEPIPVTYQLSDVKEPSKRKRSHSKTINIPGTQNNLRFFQRAYSLTWRQLDGVIIDISYDSTQAYNCEYYYNNQLEFKGYFQLMSSTILNGSITFEAVLFSNVVGLFSQLGDITLSELGWSEYDHTLTHQTIENSWDNSVYRYGLLTPNFTAGVPDAFGYLYGLVDYGFNNILYEYADNEIFPIVYQREIVEKILGKLGYTYDSTFIDSERFKRLMLGTGEGVKLELTAAQIDDLEIDLTGDGADSFSINGYIDSIYGNGQFRGGLDIDLVDTSYVTIAEVKDDLNQYDDSITTVAATGNYEINCSFDIDVTPTFSGTGSSSQINFAYYQLFLILNGSNIFLESSSISSGTTSVSVTLNRYFQSGDEYYFSLKLIYDATLIDPTDIGTLDIDFDFNNSIAITQECLDAAVQGGSTVRVATYVPNMKAVDFLNSMILHWNLYVSEPDEDGVVIIEPLNDGYYNDASQYVTWTKKINKLDNIEIEPLALTQPKTWNFKFAQDQDYYRKNYFDKWGVGYGDYIYQNQTFFAKGEANITLGYTISPPVEIVGFNLYIPRVINVDNGVIKPYKGKPRCYYYQGLRTGAWTLIGTGTETNTSESEYPQLGHLDDIDNPTFDICFQYPQEVYYPATSYTKVNAFSEYYSQLVKEVTSPDSKLMRANFRLVSEDIKGDVLRNIINIDGVLWRVNQIKDFVSGSKDTTNVELIKILDVKKRRTAYTAQPPLRDEPGPSIITDFGNGTIDINTDANFKSNASKNFSTFLADTSSNDITITIYNEEIQENKNYTFKKMSANNKLIIESIKAGSKIDGYDCIELTDLNATITIRKVGDNFYIL